jgi:ABC-type multidrug transport system permease subunit
VLAVFGLVLGVTAMLVTRFVFDALDGNGILPALLLALLAFVVAGLTTALVRMWSVIGAAIAGFALVVLGVVFSGALMPPEFLPTFLQPLVAIAPFGMATQGVIGASYFENADVDLGLFGLIAWAILAGVLLVVAERRQALAVEA